MVAESEIVIPDAYKTTVVYGPGESLVKSFQKTEQLAVMAGFDTHPQAGK